MKETRESLLVELTKIRNSHQGWVEDDQTRRKEFAKAFSWFKKRGAYDYTDELKIPTWPEIFIEVGRLLEKRDYKNLSDRLGNIEQEIFELKEKIKKEIHSNL